MQTAEGGKFILEDSEGTKIGRLYIEAEEVSYEYITYCYAPQDVSVTGSNRIATFDFTFNMSFKIGWNKLYNQENIDMNTKVFSVKVSTNNILKEKIMWSFE